MQTGGDPKVFVPVCAWCGATRDEDDRAVDFIRSGAASAVLPTHTICGPCRALFFSDEEAAECVPVPLRRGR